MSNSSTIFETLKLLGVASEATRRIYATETRDVKSLNVYRDEHSGVIYIEDFCVGEETYRKGEYRKEKIGVTGKPDYERRADAKRRAESYKQFYSGKEIADFGCGAGDFLRRIQSEVSSCCGVELQQDYVDSLNNGGIKCYTALDELDESSLGAIFSFHVLEHLANPLTYLSLMKKKLKVGGCVVIEVPHASDILLSKVSCDAFKRFTLWSQHLVLHTRYSLLRLMEYAGYHDVTIEGIQRYPLSNHLQWLSKGLPGGHKSALSSLDTHELTSAYASALRKVDATDTLVAIAYNQSLVTTNRLRDV